MTVAAAELRDVRVAYGDRVVLDVPHLELERDRTLTIMGPNGSGKSTLLRVVALLERPGSGQVLHDGLPVQNGRDALRRRRRIALVMQQPLFRNASTWENVATGLRFRHVPGREIRRRVAPWLERLGISHLAKQNIRSLSGGEAQRANLARSLVLEPELLLLDEPFTALDSPTRQSLMDDLWEILDQVHTTTVFVTHDRVEAQAMGERLAVMIEGKLRQIGRVDEVFATPSSEEVAAVVGVENVLTGRVAQQSNGLATVMLGRGGVEITGEFAVGDELVMGIRPEAVTLEPLPRSAALTTARNRLPGTITHITPVGAQARIVVDCGFRLVSLVTQQSAADLGLAPGAPVLASFKATAVHVIRRVRRS